MINSFSFPSLHLLDPTVSRFDQVTNNLHKNLHYGNIKNTQFNDLAKITWSQEKCSKSIFHNFQNTGVQTNGN